MGLDISSATTGWAILNEQNQLLDYGYIKPKNSKFELEERLHSAVEDVLAVCEKHKPDIVVVEEITQHMAGASNAKTILILAAFNRTCCYMIYRKYGLQPVKIMPATIRANIRKSLNKVGRLSKDDIYEEVRKKYTNFLPYIMDKGKNKGMERKENFDVADAIAAAWSWIITDGPSGNN